MPVLQEALDALRVMQAPSLQRQVCRNVLPALSASLNWRRTQVPIAPTVLRAALPTSLALQSAQSVILEALRKQTVSPSVQHASWESSNHSPIPRQIVKTARSGASQELLELRSAHFVLQVVGAMKRECLLANRARGEPSLERLVRPLHLYASHAPLAASRVWWDRRNAAGALQAHMFLVRAPPSASDARQEVQAQSSEQLQLRCVRLALSEGMPMRQVHQLVQHARQEDSLI